ncbi:MAG TPA: NADH-quinone oxidoreductase subunit H [Anaerolineaceae bacterium]|jgi:NADH-quinone oxidoreductase subunit H|nr:NADH-quinone oxidoreductase subunit H [Anaerolineaceae bacterium]
MFEGLFYLFVFPGLAFQVFCGLAFEWVDRKLLARFQRRVGPQWYQPLADLIKLFSKEDLLPTGASGWVATILPLISLAAVLTAGLYIPVAGFTPFSFEGDLIVIVFLMGIPTLAYYLAGMTSVGIYSILGGARSLLQYFSYEVPLLLAFSGPAILSGSWSVAEILKSQAELGPFILFQPVGFCLAIAGLIGKLKRDPLDIPKAKSEVVAGSLTEFSGGKLAFWHLTMDIQAIVGIFLLINLFFGMPLGISPWINTLIFSGEVLLVIFILSASSSIFARLRIDQLASLGWRILVPVGIIQLLFVILMGV